MRASTIHILLLSLCSLAGAGRAQEFSAQMATFTAEAQATPNLSVIYVGKDRMRIDPQQGGMGSRTGVSIINLATRITDVLIPERRMYMELAPGRGPQRTLPLFRSADLNHACSDWEKLTPKPEGSCRSRGHETVHDRDALKYEETFAGGENNVIWIDAKLHFVVKWESKDGGGELRDIQEGPQPASLLAIPADYQKLELGGTTKPASSEQ